MNRSIVIMVAAIATMNSLKAMQKYPEYYLKALFQQEYKLRPATIRIFAFSKREARDKLHDLIEGKEYRTVRVQEEGYEPIEHSMERASKKRKVITQSMDRSLEHIRPSEPHNND